MYLWLLFIYSYKKIRGLEYFLSHLVQISLLKAEQAAVPIWLLTVTFYNVVWVLISSPAVWKLTVWIWMDCLTPLPHQDVQGYKWVRWRVWLCRLAAVLSLGVLLIVFHWRPRLAVLARCCSCPLALADILLIRVRKYIHFCYLDLKPTWHLALLLKLNFFWQEL